MSQDLEKQMDEVKELLKRDDDPKLRAEAVQDLDFLAHDQSVSSAKLKSILEMAISRGSHPGDYERLSMTSRQIIEAFKLAKNYEMGDEAFAVVMKLSEEKKDPDTIRNINALFAITTQVGDGIHRLMDKPIKRKSGFKSEFYL